LDFISEIFFGDIFSGEDFMSEIFFGEIFFGEDFLARFFSKKKSSPKKNLAKNGWLAL